MGLKIYSDHFPWPSWLSSGGWYNLLLAPEQEGLASPPLFFQIPLSRGTIFFSSAINLNNTFWKYQYFGGLFFFFLAIFNFWVSLSKKRKEKKLPWKTPHALPTSHPNIGACVPLWKLHSYPRFSTCFPVYLISPFSRLALMSVFHITPWVSFLHYNWRLKFLSSKIMETMSLLPTNIRHAS